MRAPRWRSLGFRRCSWHLLLREGTAIGTITFVGRSTSVHRQTDRTFRDLRRPGRDRHRERAAVQGIQERNAELREAWSIRRQRPRCSASSAARRPTCSRCWMPSSRARREFAGSMTWCCDSVTGNLWLRGLILVPYRSVRVEVSIDAPEYRWMREHGTLHIPDLREQN